MSTMHHHSLNHRILIVLIFCTSLFLRLFPGLVRAAVVTLDSIEIYKKHELFGSKPTVFFQCKGENKTILPDVKKKHVLYIFKGEESWQVYNDEISLNSLYFLFPWNLEGNIKELTDKKCKRCGIYERDTIKPDDTFDEWELCASDFTSPHGKCSHYLKKEFKATFLCPECVHHRDASNPSSGSQKGGKRMHWALLLLICALVSIVLVLGAVTTYKCWKRKRRQQEQARFLKLFEEDDEIEDELGIGPLSHVI